MSCFHVYFLKESVLELEANEMTLRLKAKATDQEIVRFLSTVERYDNSTFPDPFQCAPGGGAARPAGFLNIQAIAAQTNASSAVQRKTST